MAAVDRKQERLRRREDFRTVMREGRRLGHRLVRVVVRPNGLAHNRWGFAVSAAVGSAVVRNRVTRRLRVIVRGLEFETGHDAVVIAQYESGFASFDELREAVEFCVRSAGLLSE